MTDLTATITPKSDQTNADDLIAGPRTIKITKVSAGTSEQPIKINYEGDGGKPYLPCKMMRRALVYVWGADGAQYPGRSLTIYRDPAVKWGGIAVGGIRISHMSHMEKEVTLALAESKAVRKPYLIKPLVAQATRQAPKSESIYDSEWVESAEREIDSATDGAVLNEWWETTAKDDRAELYKANKQAYGALKAKLDAKLSEIGG